MFRKKQMEKNTAEDLLSLHKQEKLLVLPNIWNPIGARILEAKGFLACEVKGSLLLFFVVCFFSIGLFLYNSNINVTEALLF